MSVQLNILLLSMGALQGVILFFLLYKKRRSLPGYPFLALYLWVMILQITLKIASKLWLWQTMRPVYLVSYELPFLYGPLIWLFVKRFTAGGKGNKRDTIHFLLAIILGVFLVYLDLLRDPNLLSLRFFNVICVMILQVISILAYHYLAFRDLKKYCSGFSQQFIQFYGDRVAWLRQFIFSSFVVCSAISIIICLMYVHFPNWQNIRLGFILLSVFIYWISYKSWNQPELFSAFHFYHTGDNAQLTVAAVNPRQKKYVNSSLGEREMDQIIRCLENKLKAEKYYLDPELTIEQLAKLTSCSRHHLSQTINEKLGKSFYDYVNHFRVEEVKRLLADPRKNKYKITFLAYDAGFNSISTFNDVFKKVSGFTPSHFRKQQREFQKTIRIMPDLSGR